ncbi:hypothetical protein EG103P1_00088 [Enterococcus phage EG103P1]|nr:hypothetical protein EG103P1_00088 [Enterococcus phage EG103P1]
MTEFKAGDKVRYFQDLSERYTITSPDIPIGAIGEVRTVIPDRRAEEPNVMVELEQGEVIWFYPDELQLVDEETDLPFVPQVTHKTVLDTSLDINLDVYLAALSNMTTARKQMADLSLDRYLPEAVRDALEKRLDNKIQESGKQAEEAIKRMSKILEVG